MLDRNQIESFRENGFLVVEDAVEPDLLRRLQSNFALWVEESRGHGEPFGESLDGRPRFDLEPGHSAEAPALRRVASPIEISEDFRRAAMDSRLVDAVADLIGPDIKLHHSKINSKLPGAATSVKWHQDFPFTPHSNDDLVTALLMLDQVTERNGPLEVVPGSHRGPLHSLWHDDRFTGAAEAVRCTGPAGAVCLMHTRLLHGSAPNRSSDPRTLFIVVYSAEDAVPLSDNPLPSRYEGTVVRGRATGRVRCVANELRLPQKPSGASFFVQQSAGATVRGAAE
jgi:ectoine hydroxylase-related dioxygenase (phytanoyl-CoA dioxygenase family)